MVCYGKKTVVYRIAILPSLHLQPKEKTEPMAPSEIISYSSTASSAVSTEFLSIA